MTVLIFFFFYVKGEEPFVKYWSHLIIYICNCTILNIHIYIFHEVKNSGVHIILIETNDQECGNWETDECECDRAKKTKIKRLTTRCVICITYCMFLPTQTWPLAIRKLLPLTMCCPEQHWQVNSAHLVSRDNAAMRCVKSCVSRARTFCGSQFWFACV